ncbi:MAG: Asp-tRNA(Asn)/Glu-tRNA(Gln) amidotransferase subunit GatA, partial [Planctomycetes bacterium]|nr:Asp-tRNA(Asn)/Glu-tRNA(Gln) amidotransferase subunit GatA [Planctomycetota bacterium]
VGLKPSYGRVSRYGLFAFGSSLDQIGPITRDVRDAALVLGVIAGHDARDSTSIDAPVPDYVTALDRPLKGIKIGVSDQFFAEGLDDHVRRAVRAAIDVMAAQGATVTSVDLPHLKYAVSCYYLVAPAEASSNLARFDGVHYGHRTEEPSDVIDMYRASRGEGFGLEVKRRIMLGTYALSSGYHDAYYVKALKVRTLIKRDFDEAFRTVDVIASPVAPTTAFEIGAHVDDPLAMYLCDTYTLSANLAGICGISVPCGFDDTGLPIGLQLLAPALHEETVLAAAHQYQLVSDHHTRAPIDP